MNDLLLFSCTRSLLDSATSRPISIFTLRAFRSPPRQKKVNRAHRVFARTRPKRPSPNPQITHLAHSSDKLSVPSARRDATTVISTPTPPPLAFDLIQRQNALSYRYVTLFPLRFDHGVSLSPSSPLASKHGPRCCHLSALLVVSPPEVFPTCHLSWHYPYHSCHCLPVTILTTSLTHLQRSRPTTAQVVKTLCARRRGPRS